TLTAMLNATAASSTVSLVAPMGISAVTCNAGYLFPQTSMSCTVSLTQPVPSGSTGSVQLSSDTLALSVPSTPITVPAGSSLAGFTAQAGTFPSALTATITASMNGTA